MRTHSAWLLGSWILGLLGGGAAQAADDTRPAVAVMEFASKGGVTQEQMDALGELLATDIRALDTFRVIGKSDIQAMLQYEEKKALTGCSDDSCIAEIGGALGAQYVVVGSVSLFGETYLLNLKVLDVRKISVVKGVSEKIRGGQDALLDATSEAVRQIFLPLKAEIAAAARPPVPPGDKPADKPGDPPPDKPGDQPGANPEANPEPGVVAETPEKPRSKQRLAAHITLWTGVGLTVLGGVAGVLGNREGQSYDKEREPNSLDASRGYAAGMWAGLGLGVALMVTGLTLWFTEPAEDEAAVTSGGLAPTPDGQGLVLGLGGRW
jgi:TolB-like protein